MSDAPSDRTSIEDSPPPGAAAASLTGTPSNGRLGKYRVIRQLGQGGMGAVYLGHDDSLDRFAALKMMLPQYAADAVARDRFIREARAAAKARSDYVVTIFEVGEDCGTPFIAMEYLQGQPLDQKLRSNESLPIPGVLRIGREVAEGLSAAHALGLVHRDIKPGNIWIEAPTGRVRILDFGLARPLQPDAQLTNTGLVVGTPAYMSPEQARGGSVDGRSDLFSLGGVLYRLTTGRLPFPGLNQMQVLSRLAVDDPIPVRDLNPDAPEPLADLIHQLLAKKAAARPQSAAEVSERLRRINKEMAAGEFSLSRPTWVPTPVPTPRPSSKVRNVPDAAAEVTEGGSEFASVTQKQAVVPRTKAGGITATMVVGVLSAIVASLITAGIFVRVLRPTVVVVSPPTERNVEVAPPTVPATIPAPPPTTPRAVEPIPPRPPKAGDPHPFPIELLPLIDPARDAVAGTLVKDGSSLIGRAKAPEHVYATAEIPYQPPAEYDFTVVFSHPDGPRETSLVLTLPGKGKAFRWTLGAQNRKFGFAFVGGKFVLEDRPELGFNPGQRYVARAEVRGNTVTGYLDGVKINELRTDFSDVTRPKFTPFNDDMALAVSFVSGPVAVHRATVSEIKGTGTFTRPGPTDADRRAATWVLAVGGTVGLDINGTARDVSSPGPLPTGRWELHEVNLRGCQIHRDDLERFAGTSVIRLVLDDAAIPDEALAHLKRIPALQRLVLRGTPVTDAGLAYLKDVPHLTELDLGGSKNITDAGMKHVAAIAGLHMLGVWETSVGDAGLADLARAENLTDLHLGGNRRVTDAGLAHLKALAGLRILFIGGTEVTDAGLPHLYGAAGLKELHAESGTRVTRAGLDALKAKLPGCTVEYDPDRYLADWVLTKGGRVVVADHDGAVTKHEHLPNGPVRVTGVVLTGNGYRLPDRDVARFRGCENLTSLDVHGSAITDAGFKELTSLGGAGRWTTLILQAENVTAAGVAEGLPRCRSLKKLFLEKIPVGGDGLAAAGKLPDLEDAYFRTAQLTDADVPRLGKPAKLRLLDLADNRALTGSSFGGFRDLPALNAIGLSLTATTDTGAAFLAECPALTRVDLRQTLVTDRGLAELTKCKTLKNLELSSPNVTDAGAKAFRAARPDCKLNGVPEK